MRTCAGLQRSLGGYPCPTPCFASSVPIQEWFPCKLSIFRRWLLLLWNHCSGCRREPRSEIPMVESLCCRPCTSNLVTTKAWTFTNACSKLQTNFFRNLIRKLPDVGRRKHHRILFAIAHPNHWTHVYVFFVFVGMVSNASRKKCCKACGEVTPQGA